ncbi:MAG: pyridoxamine 5'-phosphate oxidase family protein [Rubrobacteraceae bacterium]
MNTQSPKSRTHARPTPAAVLRDLGRRSFCTLATVSPAGRPHIAGVIYELVDRELFVSTRRTSRKARNIAADPHVGVCVPVRRLPAGPPASVHFQSTATILAPEDPALLALLEAGRLKSITGHGELELADGCFLLIPLPARLLTYGLGVSLRRLISDPLNAAGHVTLE